MSLSVAPIPIASASIGAINDDMPPFNAAACAGCSLNKMCERRRDRTVFRIKGERPGAPIVHCRVINENVQAFTIEHMPTLEPEKKRAKPQKKRSKWLIDANIVIAAQHGNRTAKRILDIGTYDHDLLMPTQIRDEIITGTIPNTIALVDVGSIDSYIKQRVSEESHMRGKVPSLADMSLYQALKDNDDVAGIISEDPDLHDIDPLEIVPDRHCDVFYPDEFGDKFL